MIAYILTSPGFFQYISCEDSFLSANKKNAIQ